MKLVVFICLLVSSSISFASSEVLDYQQAPQEMLNKIKEYTEYTINNIRKSGESTFGLNEQSIIFLSNTLTKQGSSFSEKAKNMLPTIWGSFLGEAIIEKHGGEWVVFKDGSYAVKISESEFWFPFTKVSKHISNGEEDSIHSLYLSVGKMESKLTQP